MPIPLKLGPASRYSTVYARGCPSFARVCPRPSLASHRSAPCPRRRRDAPRTPRRLRDAAASDAAPRRDGAMVLTVEDQEEFGPIKTLYNEMSEVRRARRAAGWRCAWSSPARAQEVTDVAMTIAIEALKEMKKGRSARAPRPTRVRACGAARDLGEKKS